MGKYERIFEIFLVFYTCRNVVDVGRWISPWIIFYCRGSHLTFSRSFQVLFRLPCFAIELKCGHCLSICLQGVRKHETNHIIGVEGWRNNFFCFILLSLGGSRSQIRFLAIIPMLFRPILQSSRDSCSTRLLRYAAFICPVRHPQARS